MVRAFRWGGGTITFSAGYERSAGDAVSVAGADQVTRGYVQRDGSDSAGAWRMECKVGERAGVATWRA